MLGLIAGLLFSGYLLVYAAVANGGVFADAPWRGLVADAYQVQTGSGQGHTSVASWISGALSVGELAASPAGPARLGSWLAGKIRSILP